jgi:hypothetical protein
LIEGLWRKNFLINRRLKADLFLIIKRLADYLFLASLLQRLRWFLFPSRSEALAMSLIGEHIHSHHRLVAQSTSLGNVSDNLANSSTVGYKTHRHVL